MWRDAARTSSEAVGMRIISLATSSRVRVVGAAATLAGLLLALAVAAPAQAADSTVTTPLELTTALATVDAGVITLANDLTLTDNETVVSATAATIDLNGHTLTTRSIAIASSSTLTIDSGVAGGVLLADASAVQYRPAIFVGTLSTLKILGGTVTALAGDRGAGIGGGFLESSGTVIIDGGTVSAVAGMFAAGVGGGQSGAGGPVTVLSGSLTATPGEFSAGIGGGFGSDGGTFTMSGGTVVATGVDGGAGIGGGIYGAAGGTTTISGGSVTATATGEWSGAGIGGGSGAEAFSGVPGRDGNTVLITGGNVVATSQTGSGIGGGSKTGGAGGNGGSVTIGSGALVTASGSNAIGNANADGTFGTLSVAGTLNIPSGALGIPLGGTATVTSTGIIAGNGSIGGLGSITNNGAIQNTTVDDVEDDATGLTISNHNYVLTFDANQADATPATTDVRVYATSLTSGNRGSPPVTHPSLFIAGWNSESDGSGSALTATTPISGDATFYGLWVKPTLVLTPVATTAIAGATTGFAVEGFNGSTSVGDYSSRVVLSSSRADDVVDGMEVTATSSGARTITATFTSDTTVTSSATLEVDAAEVAEITLTPTAPSVLIGGSITFTATATDEFGNDIGDVSSDITLVSDVATDIVDGNVVTFPTASPHRITATLNGASTTVTIQVISAAALAATGVDSLPALPLALALLLLGAMTVIALRRGRRPGQA